MLETRGGKHGRRDACARGRAGRLRPGNGVWPGEDAWPHVERSTKSRLRPAMVAGSIRVWARSALPLRLLGGLDGVVFLFVVVGGVGKVSSRLELGRSPKILE